MESTIQGNLNWNCMELKKSKCPWKNQQLEDKDRVFVSQDSISKIKTQSFHAESKRNFKRAREERSQGNILSRLDPSLALLKWLLRDSCNTCTWIVVPRLDPCLPKIESCETKGTISS